MKSKWVKRGGRSTRVRADGEIRRSQAIRTYGAGSLLDLVDRSVIIGGLDHWRFGTDGATPIVEPRLLEEIQRMLRGLEEPFELNPDKAFLPPPAALDGKPARNNGVAAIEFPQWFVCQNPRCRALVKAPQGVELKNERWMHYCDSGRYSPAVPVRFVMACKNGHLEEVPWLYLTHEFVGRPRCDSPRLTLIEGKTGDFSEIAVKCTCGPPVPLASSLRAETNPSCRGMRPWLGPEAREECDQRLRLLMRGASNSYFAQVVSGLSIPESSSELEEKVRGLLDVLANASIENLSVLRQAVSKLSVLGDATDDEVLQAVQNVLSPTDAVRPALRTAEFLQFTNQPPHAASSLPGPDDTFFARSYEPKGGLPRGIAQVVLAQRLREVSVQVGFTRLESPTPNLQGEYDLGVQTCRLGFNTDWLPASEVWGEGVFIQLDEDAVREWEDRPSVRERGALLLDGYNLWAKDRSASPPFPGLRFYLIHSLSHMIMNAIAIECGYSASALSERLYCAPRDDAVPMAAVLISTGTPGSEGTLGGLVEQGKSIVAHLQRAFDTGRLCSNDPVCAYHSPASDPTRRHREGAACHGCLYVAEPSCERFNAFLDRALVVPTMGKPDELAFFSSRPGG
ncbi:MAG: DUF1998 domain-containing protein [Myxococcota bacterium]